MPGPIKKTDLFDVDIVDAYELASDGLATTPASIYLVTTGVSTTSSTKTVVSTLPSDGEGLQTSDDHPVQVGDFLYITGSVPSNVADAKYTIASIVDDVTVTVNETIPDSTGGTYTWVYPAGASEVGFDPSNQSVTTSHNLEQALTDVANAIGSLTTEEHETLRQLIHLADGEGGPFEGFTSGAYRVTTGAPFPTNITWWTDNTLSAKIVEKQITYNVNRTPATLYWAVYAVDGVTVLATVSDSITYSGAFETSRTRTITDTPVSPVLFTAQQHKTLRQLIHLADGQGGPFEGFASGAYRTTIGGAFPTLITWYDSPAMANKYVDKTVTYTGSRQVNSVQWRVYDTDGSTVLATVTDTLSYSTFFEVSRVRTVA